MNAIEKIQQALGVKGDQSEVMMVVSVVNGLVKLQGNGRVLNVVGSWSIGTQVVVKDGTVQSVVSNSGLVIHE